MSICWKPGWCECEDCGPLVAINYAPDEPMRTPEFKKGQRIKLSTTGQMFEVDDVSDDRGVTMLTMHVVEQEG